MTAMQDRLDSTYRPAPVTQGQKWGTRIAYLLAISIGVYHYDTLQHWVDSAWEYLISTSVFNSVYFETWWATFCYAPALAIPYIMDKIRAFDKYKLSPEITWQSAGVKTIMLEALTYCTPLMILDTFMTKKYEGTGIDPAEWSQRRANLIQYTRALPSLPPTVFQIACQLVISFILYDFIFFLVHFAVHKNQKLYRWLHAVHHNHGFVHGRITNQLSVPERIILVLSANQALRIVHAHPLTRTIFVPLFIAWLVENHCGYDLPWTLNHVVPFGLVGGSAAHYAHHVHGSRHYQPFFTYIDKYIMGLKPSKSQVK